MTFVILFVVLKHCDLCGFSLTWAEAGNERCVTSAGVFGFEIREVAEDQKQNSCCWGLFLFFIFQHLVSLSDVGSVHIKTGAWLTRALREETCCYGNSLGLCRSVALRFPSTHSWVAVWSVHNVQPVQSVGCNIYTELSGRMIRTWGSEPAVKAPTSPRISGLWPHQDPTKCCINILLFPLRKKNIYIFMILRTLQAPQENFSPKSVFFRAKKKN